MLNRQLAFNIALAHLRAQGQPAVPVGNPTDLPRCMYRTPEGLKCAVGALIPDENYRPEMEGGINDSVLEALDPKLGSAEYLSEDNAFLDSLQEKLHDDLSLVPATFVLNLDDVAPSFAHRWNLGMPR